MDLNLIRPDLIKILRLAEGPADKKGRRLFTIEKSDREGISAFDKYSFALRIYLVQGAS